jgi:hypothetical protein
MASFSSTLNENKNINRSDVSQIDFIENILYREVFLLMLDIKRMFNCLRETNLIGTKMFEFLIDRIIIKLPEP